MAVTTIVDTILEVIYSIWDVVVDLFMAPFYFLARLDPEIKVIMFILIIIIGLAIAIVILRNRDDLRWVNP